MKQAIITFLLLVLTANGVIAYQGFSQPAAGFTVSVQETSLTVAVTDDAIYRTGYYSFGEDRWHPFNFSQASIGSWITGGEASIALNIPESQSIDNYIIIYSCTYDEQWECHGNQWQLHQFNTSREIHNNETISNYTIIFSQDFEDNSLGSYAGHWDEWEDDWQEEWNWFKNHEIVSIVEQDGTKAMQFIYPKGTSNGVDQGVDFDVLAPLADALYEELYLSYNIMFKPGFDFVISGKIPSLGGGKDWDDHSGAPYYDEGYHTGISWGKADWNKRGYLNFYFYHHDLAYPSGETKQWKDPDNPASTYYIDTSEERWISITLRVVMNSVNSPGENGSNDGFAEAYIDGGFAARWEGLRFRNTDDVGIDWLRIYSQFGGIGPEFATTDDEWILTDDYYLWTFTDDFLAANPQMPQRMQPAPNGSSIMVPGMKT